MGRLRDWGFHSNQILGDMNNKKEGDPIVKKISKEQSNLLLEPKEFTGRNTLQRFLKTCCIWCVLLLPRKIEAGQ